MLECFIEWIGFPTVDGGWMRDGRGVVQENPCVALFRRAMPRRMRDLGLCMVRMVDVWVDLLVRWLVAVPFNAGGSDLAQICHWQVLFVV